MARPVRKTTSNVVEAIGIGSDSSPKSFLEVRKSKELIITFAGPIGCGIRSVVDGVGKALKSRSYEVHRIKISEFLSECLKEGTVPHEGRIHGKGALRFLQLQDAGNYLRRKHLDILAQHAIHKIAAIRKSKAFIDSVAQNTVQTDYLDQLLANDPGKTAYLIDQIKHPAEVTLLRKFYGENFFQFGVLSAESIRKQRLMDEQGVDRKDVDLLMDRDKSQPDDHGQQIDKTLHLSDFFIRNDHVNSEPSLADGIERFIDLIHGRNGISPTREEYGMYVAYAAGLRSACLSRQVGAAIMSPDGNILSTGRNDVPRAGGGLYEPSDGAHDARCVKKSGRKCYNDQHKKQLVNDIHEIIRQKLNGLDNLNEDRKAELERDLVKEIQGHKRLKSLIEFSRSIHAEMDAITSMARTGGNGAKGAILFTSTFPCHNCARHIVAAGISRVYFIEPYAKSLASELHDDAIEVDPKQHDAKLQEKSEKVLFIHYDGVAPRQYFNMFIAVEERKKDGVAVEETGRKVFEYLDNYRMYEVKAVENFEKLMMGIKGLSQEEARS